MSTALPLGKLPPQLLRELLDGAPPLPAEVRLGPAPGEDACAIDVERGTLVVATDPITLMGSDVGALAVAVNANDIAVMGVRPRWLLAAILFPPGTGEQEVRAVFREMHAAAAAHGVAVVGGHTEVTAAVSQTLVVGQMLGTAPRGEILPTGGARPGDVVVQVGATPIEAAAVLATQRSVALDELDAETLRAAREAGTRPGISVVTAALAAAALGASALHDPTEGGLATGLHELAGAAGVRVRLEESAVAWFEPGVAVCRAFGADPWGALASGALLATFPAGSAERALRQLEDAHAPARAIGRIEHGRGVTRADGAPLSEFSRDEVARVLETRAGT